MPLMPYDSSLFADFPSLDTRPRSTDAGWFDVVEGRTNNERADCALKAVETDYLPAGEVMESALVDLVTGLMHLARRNDVSFQEVLRMAVDAHDTERQRP